MAFDWGRQEQVSPALTVPTSQMSGENTDFLIPEPEQVPR